MLCIYVKSYIYNVLNIFLNHSIVSWLIKALWDNYNLCVCKYIYIHAWKHTYIYILLLSIWLLNSLTCHLYVELLLFLFPTFQLLIQLVYELESADQKQNISYDLQVWLIRANLWGASTISCPALNPQILTWCLM